MHQWVGPLFLLVMDIYAKVAHECNIALYVIKWPIYLYVLECV
jgi:hypothetical protein